MSAIIAQPLEYVDVNNFSFVEMIQLIQGNGGTYYFQLFRTATATLAAPAGGPFQFFSSSQVVDAPVRYIPAAGATVSILFPRTLTIQSTPVNQDVTVACTTADARDTSIWKLVLSAANVNTIVSEGARLSLTENGVTTIWPLDHFVTRRSNAPGA